MSIHAWLIKNKIKNEKGQLIEFDNHPFLFDIYADQSQNMVVMKAAQVGLTTAEFLKNHYDAKTYKLDIIYTLPTDQDVRVMVGGKFNRIIAMNPCMVEDMEDKDSVEQKKVGDSMIYFRGCVDKDTEVLTENGWSKFWQIKKGDRLPSLNVSTNTVEMDKVQDMTVFETEENMVRIKTSLIDQLVTKDHRCVIAKRSFNGEKSSLRIERAYNLLGKRSAHIPTRFNCDESGVDSYYSVIGWVIGDGSYWTKRDKNGYKKKDGVVSYKVYETERVCIVQSKLCDMLEQDLLDAGVSYYKKKHGGGWRYELSAKDSKRIRQIAPCKKLTYDLVFKSKQSQRRGLLRGLMMSDGDNVKWTTFFQRKNGTADALQALLVLLGVTSNIEDMSTSDNRYGKQPMQRVRLRKNEWTNPKVTEEEYKGVAWCPTTKNGTIFIRRNGKVSVTGQTWSKKAAMMIPADRLVHDEKDSSKLDVVLDYQARLQHSEHKQTHTFSHPSLPDTGVDVDWKKSDQKHWFVQCPHCNEWQYLSWDTENPDNMSICFKRGIFQCKKCKEKIPDYARRNGQWVAKYKDKDWSGYWVSLLMAPWMSAKDLIKKFQDKDTTDEFWYTKVLGLPYADAASKLLKESFFQNLTGSLWNPPMSERVVIGIDTGLRLDYVIGSRQGLFYHGDCTDYSELDGLMRRWKNAIAVIDAGGDLIGSRAFAARWAGRVYICSLTGDRNTKELVKWGEGDENGMCSADRNRTIQLVVDEFRTKRIPVHGSENDWYEYWCDWNNLAKLKILDSVTNQTKGYKWVRSGRDHRALATVFWRVGMMRFAGMGSIVGNFPKPKANSYEVDVDETVPVSALDFGTQEAEHDWRV